MVHRFAAACLCLLLLVPALARAEIDWQHGLAMHGAPAYGPQASHFAYADPQAPKGGTLSQAVVGAFDSLNPFIVTGRTAAGVRQYHFASLLARSWDEPFSLYPYVAEAVAVPEARDWIAFRIDPDARFHDGTPITVADIVFTMELLRERGLPSFRNTYGKIDRVEYLGEDGVRFWLSEEADRETPLVIGLMPVLSQAWYEDRPFDRASLEIPLGSGPYRIDRVDAGRRIDYTLVEDWWAADRMAFRGQNNFAALRFDYYRDAGVALEAFKTGAYSLRREVSAERWATSYDFPAIQDGRATLLTLPHDRPEGMRGLAFNTRRGAFADRRVRQALAYAFDFDFVNRTLLHGQYQRTNSYFVNSDLAAEGLPGPEELALLEPFRDQLPPEVFEAAFVPPGEGVDGRNNLRQAQRLLQEAGWEVRDGRLVHGTSGQPLRFEILLADASNERIALAYIDRLRRLGIEAVARTVDSAQYAERTDTYDFDMLLHQWRVTLSPGAEQHFYWSSASADMPGTRNYPGVRDPVVDALIDRLTNATDREALVAAARALDRVLLWGHYVVPLYYLDRDFIAYWGDLQRVEEVDPVYGTVLDAWWQDAP